ncbi:MAG TPA: hypothetical protein VFG20_16465, partial [Planctomycetaceae bacterium]|nr:hypothetical protein [Planctomycetaceae bacterium]
MSLPDYTFFSPSPIHFGWGCRTELRKLAPQFGWRTFVLLGSRVVSEAGMLDSTLSALRDGGHVLELITVPS